MWRSQSAALVGSAVGVGDEKGWHYRGEPVKIVALRLPLATGCADGPFGFIVGVLDAKGKLLARSKELFSEGSYGNASKAPYRIDVAPYRISATEAAFGVRIVHAEVKDGWCYADEVLNLFRVVGNDIVHILSSDAFYQQWAERAPGAPSSDQTVNAVPGDPRCSFRYTEAFPPKDKRAVFHMLASQTRGFYDIQRRQGPVTVTYRWNGQRYALDGKDLVDDRVRQAWDWCTGPLYLAEHGFPPATSSRATEPAVKPRPPCARAAFRCARCDEANGSPFKVGESFVDSKRAVAVASARLQQEDAAGIARELRVGSVTASLLKMSARGMGGLAVLRQDPGRVCVTGEWAWDFGGNGIDVEIAAVAQTPMRKGVLVVLKSTGRSPHGTDDASYYPDVRLLSAFLVTADKVEHVLDELLDDEPNPSYGEWSEPVRVEQAGPSLRLICGRRTWTLAAGASEFVRATRARAKHVAPPSRTAN